MQTLSIGRHLLRPPLRAPRAVKDDEPTASAVTFLTDALSVFLFQLTHIITDRDSSLTTDA